MIKLWRYFNVRWKAEISFLQISCIRAGLYTCFSYTQTSDTFIYILFYFCRKVNASVKNAVKYLFNRGSFGLFNQYVSNKVNYVVTIFKTIPGGLTVHLYLNKISIPWNEAEMWWNMLSGKYWPEPSKHGCSDETNHFSTYPTYIKESVMFLNRFSVKARYFMIVELVP